MSTWHVHVPWDPGYDEFGPITVKGGKTDLDRELRRIRAGGPLVQQRKGKAHRYRYVPDPDAPEIRVELIEP